MRFEEGYGLSAKAIERVIGLNPDLVITVDNGIAASDEVEHLKRVGIEVIITDHHEPAEAVPKGVLLIDPKMRKQPEFDPGRCRVAPKAIRLRGATGQAALMQSVDLATLGTIADLMPMVDENRALVAEGLSMLNSEPRACIEALMVQAGIEPGTLSSVNLGFTLIPRLNAAGRMGNAQLALDLLLCDDPSECMRLAAQLEDNNERRRTRLSFPGCLRTAHRAIRVNARSWSLAKAGMKE